MKYLSIGIVAALVVFFIRFIVYARQKMAERTRERMRLFELVGGEWMARLNAEEGAGSIQRDPTATIGERFEKANGTWLVAFPLRDEILSETFYLLIGVGQPIPIPEPHVKTIFVDVIALTDPKRRWWLPELNTPLFERTAKKLSKEGLIFNIVETG